MAAVEPEIIAVFIDDENLRRDPQRDHPLPLRHDRLAGADHPHQRITILRELPVQFAAPFAPPKVAGTIHARVLRETLRQSRVARHQVDRDVFPPRLPQPRNDSLQQIARAAFNQKNRVRVRNSAAQEIAHSEPATRLKIFQDFCRVPRRLSPWCRSSRSFRPARSRTCCVRCP